jgi:hypothetical protein
MKLLVNGNILHHPATLSQFQTFSEISSRTHAPNMEAVNSSSEMFVHSSQSTRYHNREDRKMSLLRIWNLIHNIRLSCDYAPYVLTLLNLKSFMQCTHLYDFQLYYNYINDITWVPSSVPHKMNMWLFLICSPTHTTTQFHNVLLYNTNAALVTYQTVTMSYWNCSLVNDFSPRVTVSHIHHWPLTKPLQFITGTVVW